MKRYIYNIYSGSYDCPIYESYFPALHFMGYCVPCCGTKYRPRAFMYFVREEEYNYEPQD